MNKKTAIQTEDYYYLLNKLFQSYKKASVHKRNARDRLHFELRFEEELSDLAKSVLTSTYQIRPETCFIVSSPVKREIIAADFRDRVIHHYIYAYLNPYLEKYLIYDCYSCRKGKGTSFGIERLKHHILSCSENYQKQSYVLQLDIKGYFMSINRPILYQKAQQLMEKIGNKKDENQKQMKDTTEFQWVSYLLKLIIFHDSTKKSVFRGDVSLRKELPFSKSLWYSPKDCGLPIGNLTSQMFSNLYLNDFDHFVKRELKMKHYGRYVDDFYLVSTDKKQLKELIQPLKDYLKIHCNLEIHPNKIKITEVKKGITFLGVHLKPYRNYLIPRTIKTMRKRISKINKLFDDNEKQKKTKYEYVLHVTNSYLGILSTTRSFNLKRKLILPSSVLKIGYATHGFTKIRFYKKIRTFLYFKSSD